MSYMIDFPRRPLPADIRSPPYVTFATDNELRTGAEMVVPIPLNMILHFAPKMKDWIVPAPTALPQSVRRLMMVRPFVVINIPMEMSRKGLIFIIKRMMHLSGLPCKKDDFPVDPTIIDSVNIINTWRTLELPDEGLRGVETHLWSKVAMGPAVKIDEIIALWTNFPPEALILAEMVNNFIRSHIEGLYAPHEDASMIAWIKIETKRRDFFCRFESQYLNASGQYQAPTSVSTVKGGNTTRSSDSGALEKRTEVKDGNETRDLGSTNRESRQSRYGVKARRKSRRRLSDLHRDVAILKTDEVFDNKDTDNTMQVGLTHDNGEAYQPPVKDRRSRLAQLFSA